MNRARSHQTSKAVEKDWSLILSKTGKQGRQGIGKIQIPFKKSFWLLSVYSGGGGRGQSGKMCTSECIYVNVDVTCTFCNQDVEILHKSLEYFCAETF